MIWSSFTFDSDSILHWFLDSLTPAVAGSDSTAEQAAECVRNTLRQLHSLAYTPQRNIVLITGRNKKWHVPFKRR